MNRSDSGHTRRYDLGDEAPDFFLDESLTGGAGGVSYAPEISPDFNEPAPQDAPAAAEEVPQDTGYDEGEYYNDEEYYDDGEYYDDEENYDDGEYYDDEEYYEDEAPAKKKWPLWSKILIGIIAFLLVVIVIIAIIVNSMLNKIDRPEVESVVYATESEVAVFEEVDSTIEEAYAEDGVEYEEIDETEIEWTEPVETIAASPDLTTIMLIGQDARPGESRARSDTMILATFDKDNKKIYLTSFLRDLYVQVPGYEDTRLNHAFAYGGMTLLSETMMKNFGIEIDNSVVVNFESFTDVIDALGGVDIELSSAEAKVLGVGSGMQHLNGAKALEYARIRKIDNDFGRTERQRKVLSAIFQSAKSMSMDQINGLVNTIFPLVSTDMSNMDIVGYVADLMPMLADAEFITYSIPAEGTYSFNKIRGMSVIVADMQANRDILKSALEG